MTPAIKNKFLILIPAYWACLFDEAITIVHQPAAYWNGNLNRANEANPIGALFMKSHVSGIFLLSILWLIAIGVIGYFLPLRYLKIFAVFVLLAHTWGAASWLSQFYGFWYVIFFVLINSILFVRIDEVYSRRLQGIAHR
ncbi:hypothetical protein [Spirosoma validum]|uniref:Uncharacterized protein n=1 Tax=Spirosoma validum TaxID=2771355 RepID=A0A927GGN1_9BACT|nr:hypothetical protein [Spirosoma validum]MBD2756878.1 hypothetical protein [Spirosoma validum]